jgi:hypothetical protein
MFAAEQLKNMHGREKDLVSLDAEGLHVHSCIAPTLEFVGVVPNSLQDVGRASDGAKRRPVEAEGCTLARVSWRLDSLVSRHGRVTQNS